MRNHIALVFFAAFAAATTAQGQFATPPQRLEDQAVRLQDEAGRALRVWVWEAPFFRPEAEQWAVLEKTVTSLPHPSRTLDVHFVFTDRYAAPDVPGLFANVDPKAVDKTAFRRAIENLLDQLDDRWVLFYWRQGSKGSLLQNPLNKRGELTQLLNRL